MNLNKHKYFGPERRKQTKTQKATEKFRLEVGTYLAQFGVPVYLTPGKRGQKRVGGQG